MNKKYVKIEKLSVSENLANFINKELLPGTKISKEKFWKGFNKYAHELSQKNKKILDTREKLQKMIDSWHLDKKGKKLNLKEYKKFLSKIGYLVKPGKNFKIETKNLDKEISSICGPQLVCPVSNARFPTGSIIQVQENTRTATFNVAANSNYTDMGLGVVITPTSTSSKILVTLSINGYYGKLGNVAGYIHTRIARVIGGSASACTGTNTNIDTEIGRNNSQGDHRNIVMTILDEPSTTSEITYRAEYRTATGSSGVMYNDTSATSTAIAMEIVG